MQNICRMMGLTMWLSLPLFAAWEQVPSVNSSEIDPSEFADHELEVPYFLIHFARIANAVVESGPDRGFLDLKVNRQPKDNALYNARILEMNSAIAYFYCMNRPWNPYRGHPSLRYRLEAMLQRWTGMQSAEGPHAGLFTEYHPDNWSMAPTSFGSMAVAQSLDLLLTTDQLFDADLLEKVRLSLRKALMALLTREDMQRHAKQWSNQYSPVYYAALIYLKHWPDAELDRALVQGLARAGLQDQSPAGFYYEQGGPDFGYSHVHERNVRVAWPLLRKRADLHKLVLKSEQEWATWLRAMSVPQPGTAPPVFWMPAGLNVRTSHAAQIPQARPMFAEVPDMMALSLSDLEVQDVYKQKRREIAALLDDPPPLAVPHAASYRPAFVYEVVAPLQTEYPASELRNAAIQALPSYGTAKQNRQFHDPLPLTVQAVRREGYYAVASIGRIRIPRMNYGLGLLWHPEFGVALQSLSGNPEKNLWQYGTRREGMDTGTFEQGHLMGKVRVDDQERIPRAGAHDLPDGILEVSYPLQMDGEIRGQKTLRFEENEIVVRIEHVGPFTELLPLVYAGDAMRVRMGENTFEVSRPNGSSFRIDWSGEQAGLAESGPVKQGPHGTRRELLKLSAVDHLEYRLSFP